MNVNDFIGVVRDVAYDEPGRKDWLQVYNAFPADRALDQAEVDYLFDYDIPEPQWFSAVREVWCPSEMKEGHLVHTYRFVLRRYSSSWSENTQRLRRWWSMWLSREILARHQTGVLSRDSKDLYVTAETQTSCPTCKEERMSHGICQSCAMKNEDRYINMEDLWKAHAGYHFPQECHSCLGTLSRTLWCQACQICFVKDRWFRSNVDPKHRR